MIGSSRRPVPNASAPWTAPKNCGSTNSRPNKQNVATVARTAAPGEGARAEQREVDQRLDARERRAGSADGQRRSACAASPQPRSPASMTP